jgi:hypothetical protein
VARPMVSLHLRLHTTALLVHPKERAAGIHAKIDCKIAQIKERKLKWEDGIEVCFLLVPSLNPYSPPTLP